MSSDGHIGIEFSKKKKSTKKPSVVIIRHSCKNGHFHDQNYAVLTLKIFDGTLVVQF